jgi:hypothetical protein
MISNNNLNRETGLCRVWDVPAGKWVVSHPIDVREGLRCGTMTLEAPDTAKKTPAKPTADRILNMTVEEMRQKCVLYQLDISLDKAQTVDEARKMFASALGVQLPVKG